MWVLEAQLSSVNCDLLSLRISVPRIILTQVDKGPRPGVCAC